MGHLKDCLDFKLQAIHSTLCSGNSNCSYMYMYRGNLLGKFFIKPKLYLFSYLFYLLARLYEV